MDISAKRSLLLHVHERISAKSPCHAKKPVIPDAAAKPNILRARWRRPETTYLCLSLCGEGQKFL